jgi:hypothetical protein
MYLSYIKNVNGKDDTVTTAQKSNGSGDARVQSGKARVNMTDNCTNERAKKKQ